MKSDSLVSFVALCLFPFALLSLSQKNFFLCRSENNFLHSCHLILYFYESFESTYEKSFDELIALAEFISVEEFFSKRRSDSRERILLEKNYSSKIEEYNASSAEKIVKKFHALREVDIKESDVKIKEKAFSKLPNGLKEFIGKKTSLTNDQFDSIESMHLKKPPSFFTQSSFAKKRNTISLQNPCNRMKAETYYDNRYHFCKKLQQIRKELFRKLSEIETIAQNSLYRKMELLIRYIQEKQSTFIETLAEASYFPENNPGKKFRFFAQKILLETNKLKAYMKKFSPIRFSTNFKKFTKTKNLGFS